MNARETIILIACLLYCSMLTVLHFFEVRFLYEVMGTGNMAIGQALDLVIKTNLPQEKKK